jgi:hypothetical protein
MVEGVSGAGGVAASAESEYNYALYGDDLHVQPVPGASVNSTLREWFIRMPGPLMIEGPRGTGSSPTFPAADQIVFGSIDAPVEDDILAGSYVQVVAGTGFRQRRKIVSWAGVAATAGLDSPMSPVLDSTSKIATISRLPILFQDILIHGAADRILSSNGEDSRQARALYNEGYEQLDEFIDMARTKAQRSPALFDPDDGI